MNVLISSAGKRVNLVKFFQSELTKVFPGGKVFTTDLNPTLAPACQVSDKSFLVQKISSEKAIEELLAICKANHIKLIIPTIDTELAILSQNKALFAEEGISIVISERPFINICRDKRLTQDFFTKNSIAFPAEIDINNPTFPLFVKPYNGSLSKGTAIVKSANDITSKMTGNPDLMFMEYISPREFDEFTVDMYYGKDNYLKCLVPRKRIELRAGEINKGVTKKNILVSYLKKHLPHIDGATACITAQFFVNKETQQIKGIEINPRFGGGYPLSYKAGANYPAYIIKEYLLNETVEYHENWEEDLLLLRYDEDILISGYHE